MKEEELYHQHLPADTLLTCPKWHAYSHWFLVAIKWVGVFVVVVAEDGVQVCKVCKTYHVSPTLFSHYILSGFDRRGRVRQGTHPNIMIIMQCHETLRHTHQITHPEIIPTSSI